MKNILVVIGGPILLCVCGFVFLFIVLTDMTKDALPWGQEEMEAWMMKDYEEYSGETIFIGTRSVFTGGQVPHTGYVGPGSFQCRAPIDNWFFVTCGGYGCPRLNSPYVHDAVDYSGNAGQKVYAVMGGEVTYNSIHPDGFGLLLVIENGGYATYYGHLREIKVGLYEPVTAGQWVAISGGEANGDPRSGISTGAHVHYEVRHWDEERQLWISVDPSTTLLPGQTESCDFYFGRGRPADRDDNYR